MTASHILRLKSVCPEVTHLRYLLIELTFEPGRQCEPTQTVTISRFFSPFFDTDRGNPNTLANSVANRAPEPDSFTVRVVGPTDIRNTVIHSEYSPSY